MNGGSNQSDRVRARQYINDILEINRRYGMGGDPPEDTTKRAVEQAANVFKGLSRWVTSAPLPRDEGQVSA
jgi:hypothetical protein